jgi:hypothetical protein
MRRIAALSLAALGALAACGRPSASPTVDSAAIGIDELARLDLLPRLKRSVAAGLISSYDRSGGNDDGFSGKYSFLRKEEGGLVIADWRVPALLSHPYAHPDGRYRRVFISTARRRRG